MATIPTDIDVRELAEQGRWAEFRVALAALGPEELIRALEEMAPDTRAVAFRLLPRERATAAFTEMERPRVRELLAALTDGEVRGLLSRIPPDDRTELLEELPGQVTQRLLNLLSPEDLAEARHLLGYPEESVGRLMTPDYVAARPDWTVERTLAHVRDVGMERETINIIYITDNDWRLLGYVDLRRLILAPPTARMVDLMETRVVALSANADRESAVRALREHDLFAAPVVDSSGVLVGIVTFDDVLDVAQEEATEDMHRSGGLAPLEDGYWATATRVLYRKRIGWLAGLIVINLVSSSVIAAFEEVLAATIALAFFIPLLIDSGGNTGSQGATLMIRALATGDVRLGEWLRAFTREAVVGGALGLTMGALAAALGIFRGGIELGLVVGISMVGIVLLSNLVGILLPFLLSRMRLDPAMASSPLITTVADAGGLLIYFGVAAAILGT